MIPLPLEVRGSGFEVRERHVTEAPITIRTASADEADAIHELIDEHLAEGHLLPVSYTHLTLPTIYSV